MNRLSLCNDLFFLFDALISACYKDSKGRQASDALAKKRNKPEVGIMAKKMNCWEHMKCGREPGGVRTGDLGECLAAVYKSINGVNGGINGGRLCWAIVGIYSFIDTKGSSSHAAHNCYKCEFHRKVITEEGIIKPEILS
jgi:hypothetical protein